MHKGRDALKGNKQTPAPIASQWQEGARCVGGPDAFQTPFSLLGATNIGAAAVSSNLSGWMDLAV